MGALVMVQELQAEGRPLLFGKDTIDRAIMARLLDPPEQYPQWPLHYLTGCYGRATAEIRQISSLRGRLTVLQGADCFQCWSAAYHGRQLVPSGRSHCALPSWILTASLTHARCSLAQHSWLCEP